MTSKPKQMRKHLQISAEEMAKLVARGQERESLMDRIMSAGVGTTTPKMEIQPNMAGSTDSSQRMVDFTEARRIGLPAGEVDRYRSHK